MKRGEWTENALVFIISHLTLLGSGAESYYFADAGTSRIHLDHGRCGHSGC